MIRFLIRHFIPDWENVSNQKVRASFGTLGSLTGIFVNILLSATKFTLGVITGSLAVTADAVNNISDAAGSIMTLVSVRISAKPEDKGHPFGHGRAEYIGALAVGVLILVAGVQLLGEGISAIRSPHAIDSSLLAIILLFLSILAKLWLFAFYRTIARTIDSEALSAASKDSLNDVIATSAVLLSIISERFLPWPIDGWMGLVVAAFVFKAGFSVCKETVDKLMGGMPNPHLVSAINDKMLSYPQILAIHDLVVHDYGPGRCIATVHAEVDAHSDIVAIHEIIDKAERDIEQTLHITICIHMDPIVTDDPVLNRVKKEMVDFLKTINEGLTLHDFRMVPGEHQINIIFDCLVPNDAGLDIPSLKAKIVAFAKSLDPRYQVIVRFDCEYCEID